MHRENCSEFGSPPRNWQPTLGMVRNRALLTAGPGCHLQDSRKRSSTDASRFPAARDEAVRCAKLLPLILFSSLTKEPSRPAPWLLDLLTDGSNPQSPQKHAASLSVSLVLTWESAPMPALSYYGGDCDYTHQNAKITY